ncbi:MAG: hypothetical protein ABH986_00095 [archaeon]
MDEFEKKLEALDKQIVTESKKEKNLIPVCSKCGSANITMPQNPAKIYFRELKDYYCRDCGFEGPAILKKMEK